LKEIFVEKRNDILFPPSGAAFLENCRRLQEELRHMFGQGPESCELGAKIAAEIAIDLRSYLVQWKLAAYIKGGSLTQAEIDDQADLFLNLARSHGTKELAAAAEKEIAAIEHSSVKRMCELTLAGELNTVWGHDYASGLTHSLRRGARWVTSNPCKVTAYKKDFPDQFKKIIKGIKKEFANAPVEDLVSLLFMKICAVSARELRPIFEATNGEYGFVCVQTNPFNIPHEDSADKMVKQVEFWYEAFKKELQTETPNVVFKLPAVETGIEATKRLLEKSYRLCLTLNFTVTQHEIFAKLLNQGKHRNFVVLMGGLLDDKVTQELSELGIENAKSYGVHAAQAVIRKSYANLHKKGYDKNVSIMTAAVRGPWAIANTLAPAHSAPTLITTLTNKINEFDALPLPLESNMDTPVDPQIMEVLQKSKVFRQAYCLPEEGLLTWENLFEFPPFIAFYDQFRDAYRELTDDMDQM